MQAPNPAKVVEAFRRKIGLASDALRRSLDAMANEKPAYESTTYAFIQAIKAVEWTNQAREILFFLRVCWNLEIVMKNGQVVAESTPLKPLVDDDGPYGGNLP
jgi:hypothetical protein